MISQENIIDKLQQIPLFEEIKGNDNYIRPLVDICDIREYKSGEVIIKEGEMGTEMFVVYKGGVEILKQTRAGEDSVFLVISKSDFLKLGNEQPKIGLPITRAIAKILAARLRKTNSDMMTIFDALVNELSG